MKVLAEKRTTKVGKGTRTALTPVATVEDESAGPIAVEATRLTQSHPSNKADTVVEVKVVVVSELPHYTSLDEYKAEVTAKREQEVKDAEYAQQQLALHKLTKPQRQALGLSEPDPDFDPKAYKKSGVVETPTEPEQA